MLSRTERWLPRGFQVFFLLIVVLAAWQCRNGFPISSNLLELIPSNRVDALQTVAQQRVEEPLNRELVALIGAPTPSLALDLARSTGDMFRSSGLFETVQVDISVDLPQIRRQLLDQRLAMLPADSATMLADDPLAFVQARVAEISNPFSSSGAVPMDQDWLGLAHKAEQGQVPGGGMHMDLATGTLQTEHDGKTWVLLHARSHGNAFDQHTPELIANEVQKARKTITSRGAELLVAGGALYAAAGQAQAVRESSRIGTVAIVGIVLLILLSMRRPRALLALLPVLFGLLCGAVACVAVFGKIHVITLVVGASLIGVASDFPMQWLGKSYGIANWQAWPAMQKVLPGLSISLATGLVGYLALAFTPFPALRQTAVFSAGGLLGAYAFTVCQLPVIFRGWAPRPWPALARCADALLHQRAAFGRMRGLRWAALIILALVAGGIGQLHIQDDLRQWISVPPKLLDQARRIGEITGFMPTSQFFLVRAPDEQTLLTREAQVSARLEPLVAAHRITAFTSLSQLVAPMAVQNQRRSQVASLSDHPGMLEVYQQLGIPAAKLRAEIENIKRLPSVSIQDALAGPLGERWRGIWLGRQANGEYAGMVTLLGLSDAALLKTIASGIPGTRLIDRTGALNITFANTRIEAAELKAISYVIAALFLWLAFGRKAALRILCIPLAATACSLAALGYLGQPLTFFSLFGLLLVSAIAVDYAIFMHEEIAGASASLVGILLAGATTLLSFGLLAVSGTPAIANFGLSVALGVVFSLLFAPWVRPLNYKEG